MIKKVLFISFVFFAFFSNFAFGQDPKSIGKFKNWETFIYNDAKGKVCFAQTSRLFVTFRNSEKIKNEISVTSGHQYKSASVIARSGKNEFLFFSKGNFAWLLDGEEEYNLIKTMKKASKLSEIAIAINGNKTKDC